MTVIFTLSLIEQRLKLKINTAKSAVERPWNRKFLGYSMSSETTPRLIIAERSVQRLKESLQETFRRGRSRKLAQTIELLNRKLIGWANYFKLAEVRNILVKLDKWIRHKLRNIIWRQWKTPKNRYKQLIKRGLDTMRSKDSTSNGRGPWWNSGASHMNQAFTKSYFEEIGLVSLQKRIS